MTEEILICGICKRDIREINAFPIYSKEYEVICSHCCIIGAEYSLGHLTEKQLEPIPILIRAKIKNIYQIKLVEGSR